MYSHINIYHELTLITLLTNSRYSTYPRTVRYQTPHEPLTAINLLNLLNLLNTYTYIHTSYIHTYIHTYIHIYQVTGLKNRPSTVHCVWWCDTVRWCDTVSGDGPEEAPINGAARVVLSRAALPRTRAVGTCILLLIWVVLSRAALPRTRAVGAEHEQPKF